MSPNNTKLSKTLKDSYLYERIILDLKLKGFSFNEIQDHFKICYNIRISQRKIRKLIIKYGEKARKLNQYYDAKVLPRIRIAEADEVYQGQNGMNIGIADKESNYLVALNQVQSKNTASFIEFFTPFQKSLTSLQVWITDGLSTYNPTLDSLFSKIPHVVCHVHTYREVMKVQETYNRKARHSYQKLKKIKQKTKDMQRRIKNNQKQANLSQQRMDEMILERDSFLELHNIQKYSKTKKFRKKRAQFRKRINYHKGYHRSYVIQIQKQEEKLKTFDKALNEAVQSYHQQKIVALQTGRLVRQFKDLLDCNWNDFDCKKQHCMSNFTRSRYPLAKKLVKLLKNKNKVFNDKSEAIQKILTPNHANTNTIESIFGRYRLFYKKYRNMTNTQYSQAVFELLRLHHNLTPPYTGPNNCRSPIMRAGIMTKFHNSLDRLCGMEI